MTESSPSDEVQSAILEDGAVRPCSTVASPHIHKLQDQHLKPNDEAFGRTSSNTTLSNRRSLHWLIDPIPRIHVHSIIKRSKNTHWFRIGHLQTALGYDIEICVVS